MNLSDAPAQLIKAWATAGSKTNPIPVPSQQGITPGAASWTDGWPPLCDTPLSDGGIWPSMQDANGGLFQMSSVDVWMCAGGGFPYSSAFQTAIGGYPKGARVLMASGAGYWVSTVDNNMTDPDTGGAGWATIDVAGITALTGDVTATGPGSAAATLAASGVTPGSYASATITVDAKGRVTSASNTSNGFTSGSNASGYWVKDPTGHIHQWGAVTASWSSGQTFSFPVNFTNSATVQVVATDTKSVTGNPLSVNSFTVSGFAAYNSDGDSFSWMADGY